MLGYGFSVGPGDRAWHELADPRRRFADAGVCRLSLVDAGEGEPLVMIHGFADSAFTWHANVGPLTDSGFRTILIEPPGLGESEIPPAPYEFTIENQTDAVLRVVDGMDLEDFHLAGHSMGGAIALRIALRHPERVRRLALIGPACFPGGSHTFAANRVSFLVWRLIAGRWALRTALRAVYSDPGMVTDSLLDEYARPFTKPGYNAVISSLLRKFFSREFREMPKGYPGLKPPLWITVGEKDLLIPPKHCAELHARVPGSVYEVVAGSGHSPHQERPAEVNASLIRFLSGK